MTVWYDFSTTVLANHRNGIANVEWHIGMGLRGHPDVRFFARSGRGRLVEIDPDTDLAAAFYASDDQPPALAAGMTPTWRDTLRAGVHEALGARATPVIRTLSGIYQAPKRVKARLSGNAHTGATEGAALDSLVRAGDVIVSMGADWGGELARELGALRRQTGCRVITMVYDLIPITHTHLAFHKDPALFARYFDELLRVSDLITCISEQSRQDLLSFVADRGGVAPETAVLRLGEHRPDTSMRREPGDFFVWVSTLERRKNLELIYDALRILESQGDPVPRIAVVGARGWGVDDLLLELSYQSTAASQAITLLGPVDDATLGGLYARSRALLYPSHYEGWGLPVREAAVRGCPVAAGDSPAVREALAGYDGGTLLPTDDPAAWAEYLKRGPGPATPAPAHTWDDTVAQLVGYVTSVRFPGAREPRR